MAYQINEKLYEDIKCVCYESFGSRLKPIEMLEKVWENTDFPMHCPEHHYLIPAVLLTAYRKLKDDDMELLQQDLKIAEERARKLLAGFCGWYGACGAAVGSGIFLSLLTDTSPYSTDTWAMVNQLTSQCLRDIAALGGPRCCKRVCFTAVITTAAFMRDNLNLDIGEMPGIKCTHHERNAECKRELCPYFSK